MLFDFAALDAAHRYRLLTATVTPRPIAWVVTQDARGVRNAAPYSFFNVFCEEPPVLCVGIGPNRPGPHKDTAANIRATGEFVVNLVPAARLHDMHVTAIDFPPGTDELAEAGLDTLPSTHVAPPRIAASPVALECRLHSLVDLGGDRTLAVGLVLAMHIDDAAVLDAGRCQVDGAALDLIGRVSGPGGYVRASGPGAFVERRLTLAGWRKPG